MHMAMFVDVALFLIPHPPPHHQLSTCCGAVLLCACQGVSAGKMAQMWHHGTQTDSQSVCRRNYREKEGTQNRMTTTPSAKTKHHSHHALHFIQAVCLKHRLLKKILSINLIDLICNTLCPWFQFITRVHYFKMKCPTKK